MATFSQFKSKYIVEKRGGSKKQVGQEGTRNIVKKLFGKDNIPDDGGKLGQSKIEKELNLNKSNTKTKLDTEISNRKLDQLKKQELLKRQMGTLDDLSDGGNTSNTNKVNTRKPIKPSGRIGSLPQGQTTSGGTRNRVRVNQNSSQQSATQSQNTRRQSSQNVRSRISDIQKDYLNKLKDQKPKVNVNQSTKTNVIDLPKTNTSTKFSGRIGNVTNISKNKGVQLPGNLNPNPIKDNKISREISRIADRNKANQILKNMDTSDLDNQKLSKKAFKDFKKDSSLSKFKTKILSKAPVKKALRVLGPAAAVAGSALDFRNTYKQSQAKGDTKARSLGKGLSRVAGGLVGGALGAAGGSAIAPGAGTAIGGYGGYVAGQELAGKAFDTLTTSKGRKQIAKSFTNFRKRAMKPVGG